ncbi:MAG: response regulator [Lachnospiraceae bacterium]|nr:response regulator [Lachnospiraceae bacterium]MDE6698881.1 response regulator [Lachnospiraceae bacterium]
MASILIVDDSRTSRKILRTILEEAGHTVVGEAVNGDDGFKKCKELKPELVTLDITMPVLDGIEALQIIKTRYPEIKVIMVTAAGQNSKMVEAVKYGADDFIAKPFEAEQILSAIKKIFG